jgi:hypothetical protein
MFTDVVATVSTMKEAILRVSIPSFPSSNVVMTPEMKNCFLEVTITVFHLHQAKIHPSSTIFAMSNGMNPLASAATVMEP